MKFPTPLTLSQVAQLIECTFVGDAAFPVLGMNEIHVVEAGDIVFVDHPKYYDKALQSAATIVLINKEVNCPEGKALLISEDPFRDFNKLTQHFKPFIPVSTNISSTATIGKHTVIQPNCFVGNNVTIGDNCIIHANVSLYDDTIIGDNCIIHSGSVLGGSGFYYKNRPTGFDQLLSGGRVIVKDNVHIGAACTIDKGVSGDTIIGEGSKLDNQIQIGHDTVIGKKCLIASHTGIAGCCVIEDDVTIWGQVGVRSDVVIGAKSVILGKSGVTKSIKGNQIYSGNPAQPVREELKQKAFLKKSTEVLALLKQFKSGFKSL